jgi:2,4-dienoyl-CoA reductase-like NADH-dependent reductase (Old Yellow Enzyme family)/thioredoxin reductase
MANPVRGWGLRVPSARSGRRTHSVRPCGGGPPVTDKYPLLFRPLQLGSLTLRNRILQTAHDKHYSWGGFYTQRDVDYQVARARGGAALLVTGNRAVHPSSAAARSTLGYLRAGLDGDRRVVSAVHEHGAAIFAQLGHTGANPRVNCGPSTFASPVTGNAVKAMELADIRDLIDHFGRSAEIARDAGFDGVELHFAHSYLVHQFLSPFYNWRDDDYGGSLEKRLKLPSEIAAEVRKRLGDDYVLGVRLAVSDFVSGGTVVEDTIATGRALRAIASVDYLSVSTGGGDKRYMVATSDVADGWLLDSAGKVKAAFPDLPVFAVGGIKEAALAEEILSSGKADMVGMTRAQIADPDLVTKIRAGREDEVYHCIRGNQGCIAGPFSKGQPVTCTVNPTAGREGRFGQGKILPSTAPKRWVVVGGGPAGMKAAETLAGRGHSVTLLERERQLGGQVNLIVQTPGREEFGWITRDLMVHIERLKVNVVLDTEATVDTVAEFAPDGIIVATGALPDEAGISRAVAPFSPPLASGAHGNVVTTWEVIRRSREFGKHVVVLDDDGTRVAAGTAEVLLDAGCEVDLITRFNTLFPGTSTTLDMPFVYERLLTKGLRYRLNSWASNLGVATVSIHNLFTGAEDVIADVDTVVLATLPHPNDSLYVALQAAFPKVQRIGDCVAPRKLDHAIYEGFLAGAEESDQFIREGELEAIS